MKENKSIYDVCKNCGRPAMHGGVTHLDSVYGDHEGPDGEQSVFGDIEIGGVDFDMPADKSHTPQSNDDAVYFDDIRLWINACWYCKAVTEFGLEEPFNCSLDEALSSVKPTSYELFNEVFMYNRFLISAEIRRGWGKDKTDIWVVVMRGYYMDNKLVNDEALFGDVDISTSLRSEQIRDGYGFSTAAEAVKFYQENINKIKIRLPGGRFVTPTELKAKAKEWAKDAN